ncbi:MAG: YgaP family membrane protein [Nanoarchaeota archaeon]
MFSNVGKLDRVIRFILGAILIAYGFMESLSQTLSSFFIILGLILVITGIVGFCPLYKALGVSTSRPRRLRRISKRDIEMAIKNHGVSKSAPLEKVNVMHASTKSVGPSKSVDVKKKTSTKKISTKKTPVKKTSVKKTSVKKSSMKETKVVKKATTKKAATKKSPSKKTVKKSSVKKTTKKPTEKATKKVAKKVTKKITTKKKSNR